MSSNIILILLSCFLTAIGQIAFKYGADKFANIEFSLPALPGLLWRMGTAPSILLGFFLFGVGAVLWLFALARTDLSYAVPLASVTYILVLIAGVMLFREPFTAVKLAGTLLVAAGVVLVSWK